MGSKSAPGRELPPAVFLMGPTAAGKTAAAFALADELPVELISVDSAQVYRGMDIGSAKPDAETLARYPHGLIDIRDPEQTYSAADFAADAEAEIHRIHRAGRWPVLVGGTVLYYRALLYGLDAMPAADPVLRQRIAEQAESLGWEALHAELANADPQAAAGIRRNDRQRIQRAVEILRLTGQGPSALKAGNRVPRLDTLRLVLTPADRHVLHERIESRYDTMLEQGLVEEVGCLRQRKALSADHASMKSVGYRQVWALLEGLSDADECRFRAIAATRQLAKRQLTALRGLGGTLWHDSMQKRTIDAILMQVCGFFGHRATR